MTTSPNPGSGYLWDWLGNKLTSYAAGATVAGGDFDIADVALASPADSASITLPAQFCWTPRSLTSDTYRVIFYNPSTDASAATPWVGHVSCATVNGLPSGWPAGVSYQWWVQVGTSPNPDAAPYNYGDSYGDRVARINF